MSVKYGYRIRNVKTIQVINGSGFEHFRNKMIVNLPDLNENDPVRKLIFNTKCLHLLGGLDLTSRHWWIIATVLLLAAAVGVGVPIALKITAGAPFDERLEVASRLLQVIYYPP